jgi:hypothetical protein
MDGTRRGFKITDDLLYLFFQDATATEASCTQHEGVAFFAMTGDENSY